MKTGSVSNVLFAHLNVSCKTLEPAILLHTRWKKEVPIPRAILLKVMQRSGKGRVGRVLTASTVQAQVQSGVSVGVVLQTATILRFLSFSSLVGLCSYTALSLAIYW